MTEAENTIKHLKEKATSELSDISTAEALEMWRVTYLGRKGVIPVLLRGIKDLPVEERKVVGKMANEVRQELEAAYEEKKQNVGEVMHVKDVNYAGTLDIDIPGHIHPLTLTIRRIQNIFTALGFLVVEGPEVEEARYNFDQLNISFEHPARAETDTFYVKTKKDEPQVVLRTHTSPVQVRAVLENDLHPPFKVLSPGRVFRSERTDATHETTFYQFEGLVVGEDISVADLRGVIETFYSLFFGSRVTIRLRPSYFPFVEPGFEIDMSCVFCQQKGCRVCKQSGWIEVMGAGMVHPNVLRNMNVDPKKYQGFAFGGAVDRATMIRHSIDDIRLFWAGDIRFLKQFT